MKIIKYYVCEGCGAKIPATDKDLPVGWMAVRGPNYGWSVLCPKERVTKNPSIYSTTTNYYSSFPQPLKDKGARKTKNDEEE